MGHILAFGYPGHPVNGLGCSMLPYCDVGTDEMQEDRKELDHKGAAARKNGLALVVARISSMNRDGLPVVLTGDFNMESGDPAFSGLDSMMKNARNTAKKTDSHHSYNGWGKSESVIDYIYYSGFSECREFSTVTKPYAERRFISDHFPIMAELIF